MEQMKALTYNQQKALDFLKTNGGSCSIAYENIGFDGRSMKSLVKKGLVEITSHSRFREDDREMVYWSEYSLVKTELIKALL
jgi:hypothetical protein